MISRTRKSARAAIDRRKTVAVEIEPTDRDYRHPPDDEALYREGHAFGSFLKANASASFCQGLFDLLLERSVKKGQPLLGINKDE